MVRLPMALDHKLVRKSVAFSKADRNHIVAIRHYLYLFNLARLPNQPAIFIN